MLLHGNLKEVSLEKEGHYLVGRVLAVWIPVVLLLSMEKSLFSSQEGDRSMNYYL